MLMRNGKRTCSVLYLFYFLLVFGRWNNVKSQEGEECRFIYRDNEGYITSPNYPNIYPSKQNCSYTVVAREDQQISLYLEDFVLETSKLCNFDKVSVFDGKDTNAPLLRTYCGRVAPETMFSSGNSINVLFLADEDGALKGFKIKYKAVKKCYEEFDSKEGQIVSPDYPSVYPHNIQCHYIVKVAKDQSVRISFKDFQLENVLYENCFDYVQIAIYRESSWGQFGEVFCSNEAPKDFCVDSKDVMIRFMSDNVVNERGFKAIYEIGDIKCDGTRHQKRLKNIESSTIKHQVKASKSVPMYNDGVTATRIVESIGEHYRKIELAKSTTTDGVSSGTVYNVGGEVRDEETTVQVRTKAQGISYSVTHSTGVVHQETSVAVSGKSNIAEHKDVYEKPTEKKNNGLSTTSMQRRIKPSFYSNISKTNLGSVLLQEESIIATRPNSMLVNSVEKTKNTKLSVTVTIEPSQAIARSVDLDLKTIAPKKSTERAQYSDHIDASVSTLRTAGLVTDSSKRDSMNVTYHKNTEKIEQTSLHEMRYASLLSTFHTKESTIIRQQRHRVVETPKAFLHDTTTSALRISSSSATKQLPANYSGTENTSVPNDVGTEELQSSTDFISPMYQKSSSLEYDREIKPSISAAITNWSNAVHLKMSSFQKIGLESTGNLVINETEEIVSSRSSISLVPVSTIYSDQSISSIPSQHSEIRKKIKPFVSNIAYSTSVKTSASSTSTKSSVIQRNTNTLEASLAKMFDDATTNALLSQHYSSTATLSTSIHHYKDLDTRKETSRNRAGHSLIQGRIKPSEALSVVSPATVFKSPSRPKEYEIATTLLAEQSESSKHLAVSRDLSTSKSTTIVASLSLSPTPKEESVSVISSSKHFEALTINKENIKSVNRDHSSSKQTIAFLPTASYTISEKQLHSTSNLLSSNYQSPVSLHSSFASHTTFLHEDQRSVEMKQIKILHSTFKGQTQQHSKMADNFKVSSSSNAAVKTKVSFKRLDATTKLYGRKGKLQFKNRSQLSEEEYTGSSSDVLGRLQVTESLALQKSQQSPELTTVKPDGASQIKTIKTLVSSTKSHMSALASDTKTLPLNTLPKSGLLLTSEALSDHKKSTSSAFTVFDATESLRDEKTDKFLPSVPASSTGLEEILFTAGTAKMKVSRAYNSKIKPTINKKGRKDTTNLGHKYIVSPVFKHSAVIHSASFNPDKHVSVFFTKPRRGKQDNIFASSASAKQISLATRDSSRKYIVEPRDMSSASQSKTFAASPSISAARTTSVVILISSSKTEKSLADHEFNKASGTKLTKNHSDKPASTEKVLFSSQARDSTVLPKVVSSLIYKDLQMSSKYKSPLHSKDPFISNILKRKSNLKQSIIQPTVYLRPKKPLAEIRNSVPYSKTTIKLKTMIDSLPVKSTKSFKQDIRPTQSIHSVGYSKEDSDISSTKISKTKQDFLLIKPSESTSYSLPSSSNINPYLFATSSVILKSSSRINPQPSKIHQKKLTLSLQGKIKAKDTSPKTTIDVTSHDETKSIFQSDSLPSSSKRSTISRTKSSSLAATSSQSSLISIFPDVINKLTTSSASLKNTPSESKLLINQPETSKPRVKTTDKSLLETSAQTATSINQGKSKKLSLTKENEPHTTISSRLDLPAVSSVVAANKKQKECSNHFILNIKEIEESESLKEKMNEIQQLKMKRIIAVRWPYNGYLGRIGFLHKGFVIQTVDNRLWYNHVSEADETIYIIKLKSLQMLHKAVKVTHSQAVDDTTLGTHIHAWGLKIGMYFNHCKDGSE